jgi:small subunit ribosomal protein S9
MTGIVTSTGKRKSAIARVRMFPGTGTITCNGRTIEDYFPREASRMIIHQPLEAINGMGRYDIVVNLTGGGLSGQADALRHGISRALEKFDEGNRPTLKKNGMLTRDARKKERKKYGQKGARARFQFSKR